MSRVSSRVVIGILFVLVAGHTCYGLTLTLSLSSPDDLSNLALGQSVTVNVSLSGLAPPEELVSLTGSVLFPGAVWGMPTAIDPGAIVPSPLFDPADFQTTGGVGLADAFFQTIGPGSTDHILANGVFYSFDVTVAGFGSGQFALDPPALIAEQFNPAGPPHDLRVVEAGPPLSFSVIPEPLTAVGIVLGAGCVAGRLLRRRRRT